MTDRHRLARGIADAFLAGPWTAKDLAARATDALGERPSWLARLAWATVRAFPAPPELEVLSLYVAGSRALVHAIATAPGALVLRKVVVSEPRMNPMPGSPSSWAVPDLPTEGDLARWLDVGVGELRWFADPSGRLGREPKKALQHYARRWARKRSRGHRLIEAPKRRLKAIQRKILRKILQAAPVHPAAHGFERGRGVRSFVAPHVGKHVVVRLDLREFFASVGRPRVHAIFRALGFPTPVARILAGLCTTRVSIHEWAEAPRPVTPEDVKARFVAGGFLRAPHLPQGAPTSPALANLCAYRLDLRLAAAARSVGARYTRYADDLALSGDSDFGRGAHRFVSLATRIITDEGFAPHPGKARVLGQSARQELAGVVVNVRPNVPRAAYDRLKAILHNCVKKGPESQNREHHPDFRAHLTGRVSWVRHVNPARGEKLSALLDAIAWPESEAPPGSDP